MSATLSMSESMNPFIQKCLYIRKKTGGLRGRKWLRSTLLLPVLAEYLEKQGTSLVAWLGEKERERQADYLESSHSVWVNDKVRARFNAQLYAPEEMCSYKDTADFFWVTDHGTRGRIDMVVYSFPYVSGRTFTLDYLGRHARFRFGRTYTGGVSRFLYDDRKAFLPPLTRQSRRTGNTVESCEAYGRWKAT